MRLPKFFTVITMITVISLFYVHQQTELIKQSYKVRSNQDKLNDLLDRNRVLEYNVVALKAPFNLEDRLAANDIKLVLPERWQVVHVAGSAMERGDEVKEKSPSPVFAFFKFFTLSRVAQAKPIE